MKIHIRLDQLDCSNCGYYARSLNRYSSIFTAEALAINIALEQVAKSKNLNHVIFTDSLSVLQALASCKPKALEHSFITQARNSIFFIEQQSESTNPLQFFWVPAHKGILGNEIADSFAKQATCRPPGDDFKVPYSDFKRTWKKMAFENTRISNLEQAAHKGIFYFGNFYEQSKFPWFKGRHLNRKTIVTINRLRSNHYNSAASLARKNFIASPGCDRCGHGVQDFDHLLWYCPQYATQREVMFASFNKFGKNFNRDSLCILKNLNSFVLKIILKFLGECDINL